MASKRFGALERHVESEYRRKGYSLERARRIGRAVAGQVARRKRNPQPRNASGRFAKRKRNPRTKYASSAKPFQRGLFGNDTQATLFGEERYIKDAVRKVADKHGAKVGKARTGQGSLDIGGTRGLFG